MEHDRKMKVYKLLHLSITGLSDFGDFVMSIKRPILWLDLKHNRTLKIIKTILTNTNTICEY